MILLRATYNRAWVYLMSKKYKTEQQEVLNMLKNSKYNYKLTEAALSALDDIIQTGRKARR